MSLFVDAFNRFRKDGAYVFLIDLATILLLIWIVIAVKNYLGNLVYSIEGLGTSLGSIASSNIDKVALANVLGNVEPVLFKYYLVFYFLLPVGLFILAVVSKGISFGVIQERSKKIINYRYLLRFALFLLPVFIIGIMLIAKVFELLSMYLLPEISAGSYEGFIMSSKLALFLLVVGFIVAYFTFISFNILLKKKIKNAFNDTFRLGVKKAYVLFPLFLVLLIIMIILDNSLLIFLFNLANNEKIASSLIIFLLLLVAIVYAKFFAFETIKKYQQDS